MTLSNLNGEGPKISKKDYVGGNVFSKLFYRIHSFRPDFAHCCFLLNCNYYIRMVLMSWSSHLELLTNMHRTLGHAGHIQECACK